MTGVPLLAIAPKASNLAKGDFFGSLPRLLTSYSVFEQVSPPLHKPALIKVGKRKTTKKWFCTSTRFFTEDLVVSRPGGKQIGFARTSLSQLEIWNRPSFLTRFQLGQPPLKGLKFAVACNFGMLKKGSMAKMFFCNNIPNVILGNHVILLPLWGF